MKKGDKVKYQLTGMERIYLNNRRPPGANRYEHGDHVDADVVEVHPDGSLDIDVPGLPAKPWEGKERKVERRKRVHGGAHVGAWKRDE